MALPRPRPNPREVTEDIDGGRMSFLAHLDARVFQHASIP